MPTRLKVGILGGTGYAGIELLRLLSQHQQAEVIQVASRSDAGKTVSEVIPALRGYSALTFVLPEQAKFADCDVVFFATPNGTAMTQTAALLERGVRVIDLAADFRLNDVRAWEHWYGMPHAAPSLLKQAVYGLPEHYRQHIKTARLIANPGCYATAVQLGFMPLLEANAVDTSSLIADAKSGVSGAGRRADVANLFAEVGDSFKAYATSGHRHLPEMRQELSKMAGKDVQLTFIPHLVPMIRGIHATLYARLTKAIDPLKLFVERYQAEPFVDVLPLNSHPDTRSVRGANFCRIAVQHLPDSNTVVVLSVIDNLVKGAAGQAVQNMNIMFELEETMGLETPPLFP